MTTPASSPLGPITPIRCTEPGCHWACHGVPDKYADSRARIVREHVAAEHARQVLGTPTTDPAAEELGASELTADEARELVDELGADLYQAQDALAFVEECCVIADREQTPVTTAHVREWLKGARCGRQLAADAASAPAAPADRATDRRDRYAAAIRDNDGWVLDGGQHMLDAVIAVADAEINEHREHIAVYRKDSAAQYQIIAELEKENARLRRLADEAQPTEAWPTETGWIGEVLEDDGAWMFLGASPDRSVAERRCAHVTRRHPEAQTRIVRKTTTYTVEPAIAATEEPQP